MQAQVTSPNSSNTSFEARFARWVIEYRWWVLPLSVLMVVAMASGGRLLHFSADYAVFFEADNPERVAYETFERTFSKSDNFLFIIAPHDGNAFSRETLAVVVALTDTGWKLPYSSRVDSISNYQHTEAVEDDLVVRDLVIAPAQLSDAEISKNKIRTGLSR